MYLNRDGPLPGRPLISREIRKWSSNALNRWSNTSNEVFPHFSFSLFFYSKFPFPLSLCKWSATCVRMLFVILMWRVTRAEKHSKNQNNVRVLYRCERNNCLNAKVNIHMYDQNPASEMKFLFPWVRSSYRKHYFFRARKKIEFCSRTLFMRRDYPNSILICIKQYIYCRRTARIVRAFKNIFRISHGWCNCKWTCGLRIV